MGSRPAATRRLRHRGIGRDGDTGDFGACTTVGRRTRRFAFRHSDRIAARSTRRTAGAAIDALRSVRVLRAGTQSDNTQAQKPPSSGPNPGPSAVAVFPTCTVGAAACGTRCGTGSAAAAAGIRSRRVVCKSELGGQSADQRVLSDDDGAYSRAAGGTSAGVRRTSGAAADRTSAACRIAPHAGRYRAACFRRRDAVALP